MDFIAVLHCPVYVNLHLNQQYIICEIANSLIVLHGRDGEHVDATMFIASASSGYDIAVAAEELHRTVLGRNDNMLFGMYDADGEGCFAFICCCYWRWLW